MNKFLDLHFWFNIRPGNLSSNALIAIIVILAIFLAGTILSSFSKFKKRNLYFKIWKRVNVFCLTNFIVGLFLLFFAYEALVMLSMRFLFFLWFLGIAVWLGFITKDLIKIPEIREKIKEEEEFKKYIP
jgi:uncharacterized membrane protein YfcA